MCDTFAVGPSWSGSEFSIFGKNSDREPDEAHLVVSLPRISHENGEHVACTYITIPQVEITYAAVLSKPFWIWGAEMGVNEKGVVIGNEAIFTKYANEKKPGLIGMDLLRLALERADCADGAADVIINLMQSYGQGGACGYRDKRMSYMNSYLIMDRSQVIVLETMGRDYALKSYKEYAAISNAISLSTDWERSSHKPGTDLKSFKDPFMTYFAGGTYRRKHNMDQIKANKGRFDIADAFKMLRSHHADKPLKGFNRDVCMHAADPLIRRSQTTGSLVVALDDTDLFKIFVTGGSVPCLTPFKPLIPAHLPDGIDRGSTRYSEDSLWWIHERFHISALFRYEKIHTQIARKIAQLEQEFCHSMPFYAWDDKDEGLQNLSSAAFEKSRKMEDGYLERFDSIKNEAGIVLRLYWQSLARRNMIPVV